MTQEQKAKLFDKAYKVAESIHRFSSNPAEIKRMEQLFPALKESEDEKIRKELIQYLKDYPNLPNGNYCRYDFFAWLEKQGEQKFNCDKLETFVKEWRDRYSYPDDIDKFIGFAESVIKWYQQNEQKSTEEYNIRSIGSKHAQGKLGEMIKNLNPVNEILEQKSADKVEPKFKVGDWVVTSYGMVNQVIAVDEDGDGFTLDDDTYLSGSWKDNFHLWTIQDAKDGDVLQLGEVTAIFKEFIGDGNCRCYCSVCNGEFEILIQDGADNSYGCHNAIPATKEQREQLEKAMADAGYTFDFEKKELKKIEQNPAWSEEDEKMCQETIDWFEKKCFPYALESENPARESISWLKSLKDRVQPQIKQKWSEDDKKKYIGELQSLMFEWSNRKENMGICIDRHIDKLLSLHPQSHWKPSDEQIIALRWVLNNIPYNKHKEEISGLLDQIKDL